MRDSNYCALFLLFGVSVIRSSFFLAPEPGRPPIRHPNERPEPGRPPIGFPNERPEPGRPPIRFPNERPEPVPVRPPIGHPNVPRIDPKEIPGGFPRSTETSIDNEMKPTDVPPLIHTTEGKS